MKGNWKHFQDCNFLGMAKLTALNAVLVKIGVRLAFSTIQDQVHQHCEVRIRSQGRLNGNSTVLILGICTPLHFLVTAKSIGLQLCYACWTSIKTCWKFTCVNLAKGQHNCSIVERINSADRLNEKAEQWNQSIMIGRIGQHSNRSPSTDQKVPIKTMFFSHW